MAVEEKSKIPFTFFSYRYSVFNICSAFCLFSSINKV